MLRLFSLTSVSTAQRVGSWRQGALVRYAALSLVLGAVTGCSTMQDAPPVEAELVSVPSESLGDLLGRAEAEESLEGGRERARLIYREAAKNFPTDKRPWQRLAQSYFDASDYGNAVLAAQEVVQRDSADSVAHSLLAISGLRVATVALTGLRSQSGLNGSTRVEADEMARNLRSILGQSVLVPKVGESPVIAEPPEQKRASVPIKPAVAPVVRPILRKPPVKAANPLAPSGNPFGGLR